MFLFGKGKVNKQIDELTTRFTNLKTNNLDSNMNKNILPPSIVLL